MTVQRSEKTFRMIAKTLSGLEDVLAEELRGLGATAVTPRHRSVEFTGDKKLLYAANLWCRTATRILKPMRSFMAGNAEKLYKQVYQIDWTQFLDSSMTIAIDSLVLKSNFDNSMFVSLKAKDAIVDHVRDKTGRRPSVDTDTPDLRINIHMHENRVTLSFDASGEPLTRRGYRKAAGTAPLSEVLAAGILKLSEWDMKSPLVDGMCGSGTIVIEAALMAQNIAPGLMRGEFGYATWKDFDRRLHDRLVNDAVKRMKPDPQAEILGSDIDGRVLKEALGNARRADVAGNIAFKHMSFESIAPPPGPGVLIMNPPYGERMKSADIMALYAMIGDTLKNRFEGYRAYIFSGNSRAVQAIGLRSAKKIKLFNGPIECRLCRFDMYSGSRKAKYHDKK